MPLTGVLIGEPETDDHQHLLGGRVLFFSPDRDEINRKAMGLELDRIAVRDPGTWPEPMAMNLSQAEVDQATSTLRRSSSSR